MAHATTASASYPNSGDLDARLKNLKKNILPEQPYRLTEVNDLSNARRHGATCKYCGQKEENCFCHAHHTFLSREEMATYSERNFSQDGSNPAKITPFNKGKERLSTPVPNGTSTGKKLTFDAYKKLKQEGAALGRSPAKDALSPAVESFQPREHSTKQLPAPPPPTASSTLLADPVTSQHNSDRPTKKLKMSADAPSSSQNALSSSQAKSSIPTKDASDRTTTSQPGPTSSESLVNGERKPPLQRPSSHKRETSTPRPKSPMNSGSSIPSKRDQSRTRRSPSPQERLRVKAIGQTKKDEAEHKIRKEKPQSKDVPKPPRILPKMLSPLPEELNRLVDEYERKRAQAGQKGDAQDTDPIPTENDRSRKAKKVAAEISTEAQPTRPDSRNMHVGDKRPTKMTSKADSNHELRDGEKRPLSQMQSPRVGQKVPAKRPPADFVARSQRDPSKLIVTLRYDLKNAKRVQKLLRVEVDRGKCEKCRTEREERQSPDTIVSKASLRDKSPQPTLRVPSTSSKSIPVSKPQGINGQAATPNRKLPERPRTSEQGTSSRLSITQTNERDNEDIGDNELLRADGEAFLALGIKLKHKADAALGVKSSEDANLNHAAVYACHCVIAYFLSFGLDDELRRRKDKRSSTSESWRSVVAYIDFLLSSRLKANLAIHGLLYQLGAICSERVSSFEQQRFMSIPLAEPGQTNENGGRNVLDSVRRSRNELIRILRTNHDWWNLGHQRLPWISIQSEFPRTWSKRSTHVIKKPQITVNHYLSSFYLPLYSGTSAFEAATFAWLVTQEWAAHAGVQLDTGLNLTWSRREDKER